MKGTHLGEFEELVLLAVCTTHPDTYGSSVKDEINETAKRSINLSTAHGALARLEEKGYLTSYMGETTSVRGGKRKRIFEITASGIKQLEEAKALRSKFWDKIPKKVLQTQFQKA